MIEDNNLFMMCSFVQTEAFRDLPVGFYFDVCKESELEIWKAFPFDNEEQAKEYQPYMTKYFNDVYGYQKALFFENCIFVRNERHEAVATCFLWKAYGKVNTLHWFKVKKEYENQGIGRALLTYLLKDAKLPIFLHTQPGSYRAIKLYTDFGFAFLKDQQIGRRKNQLDESLPYLKQKMEKQAYRQLTFAYAPTFFLEAASSSQIDEF